MAFINVINVKKIYNRVPALDGVSFSLHEGERVAIRGASGSGKSTLLYLIGGLDGPTSGSIEVAGKKLDAMDDKELAHYRNAMVGFVFQFHFLLPSISCLDNILLPARIGNVKEKALVERAQDLAESLGVLPCLKKFPYELSGGEQQRVNIIRAVLMKPRLLLCDEPTGNLDSENSRKVTQLLQGIAEQEGATLVVVTHDQQVAAQFDRTLEMRDGRLI
jgi:ABC-type lipoprotein export system ATPase subunit